MARGEPWAITVRVSGSRLIRMVLARNHPRTPPHHKRAADPQPVVSLRRLGAKGQRRHGDEDRRQNPDVLQAKWATLHHPPHPKGEDGQEDERAHGVTDQLALVACDP